MQGAREGRFLRERRGGSAKGGGEREGLAEEGTGFFYSTFLQSSFFLFLQLPLLLFFTVLLILLVAAQLCVGITEVENRVAVFGFGAWGLWGLPKTYRWPGRQAGRAGWEAGEKNGEGATGTWEGPYAAAAG